MNTSDHTPWVITASTNIPRQSLEGWSMIVSQQPCNKDGIVHLLFQIKLKILLPNSNT
jgi:hypothetical protein